MRPTVKAGPTRARSSDPNQSPQTQHSLRHDPLSRQNKGKGKAVNQDYDEDDNENVSTVTDLNWLLNQSFTLHSLPLLHNQFRPTDSFLLTLSTSLRSFLSRQLPSLEIALATAKLVPITTHNNNSPSLPQLNLILIEIQAAQYGDSLSTSSFVLVPSPSGPGGRKSQPANYPLLLTKAPSFPQLGTSLLPKLLEYFATRHDASPSAFRIPASQMLSLLETLVAATHHSHPDGAPAGDTCMTWAFPSALAKAGLSSMTITLPPPLVSSLLETVDEVDSGGFCGALTGYLEKTTGLGLDKVLLAKLAVGSAFIHSGVGAAASASSSGGLAGGRTGGLGGVTGGGGGGGGEGGGAGKLKLVGLGGAHQVLVSLAEAVELGRQM